MAKESLLSWLHCTACQRRAVATKDAVVATTKDAVVATKDAVVGKKAICPISGQAGDCPFSKSTSSTRRSGFIDASKGGLTKVEKVLQRGSELCSEEKFTYSELSYDKAIEIDPLDWRGYYGKVVALQGQGRYFKAFQACQRGCEALPEDTLLLELKETTREDYKAAKAVAAVQQSAAKAAPDCPISSLPAEMPVSRPWSGRLMTREERKERKEMMLNIFREQWARIGKAKETMGYADYTAEQQSGLQISGGHRPLPRPKDLSLPKGFRDPIGIVTSEHLHRYYNCDCERLLISIHGEIFDVSDRPDKYAKDAPYYYFAGRDITWGLVTGNDCEQIVNMFFDLFKMDEEELNKKMQCICSWTGFYEVEYGKAVGRLAEFEAEHELPAPPVHEDTCVVQ